MRKQIVAWMVGMALCSPADVAVTDVVARQRYPWNGLVDITCTVSGIDGETNGLNLAVATVMPDTGRARSVKHFQVEKGGKWSDDREVRTNGTYRLLWDPSTDLGPVRSTNMVVRVTAEVGVIHDNGHCGVQLWAGGPYWATTNIGAEEPGECGLYFWWGDTVGYRREGKAWVASDGSSQNFSFATYNTPTSSRTPDELERAGWVVLKDGTYVLAPKHDAAHVHWGGSWRVPTQQEFSDLCDTYCDWTWTKQNGVNGYVVHGRGAFAEASIFLPIASRVDGTSLSSACCYWSSVPRLGCCAYQLGFNSSHHNTSDTSRYFGQPVRPVQGFAE